MKSDRVKRTNMRKVRVNLTLITLDAFYSKSCEIAAKFTTYTMTNL